MGNEFVDTVDSLQALAYAGPCLEPKVLENAIQDGLNSEKYRELIGWLTEELHVLRKTDEQVSADAEPNDFAMELAGLLKELGCPYEKLISGPLSERFEQPVVRLELIEYLIAELMAIKMVLQQRPAEQGSLVIKKVETDSARALELLAKDLGLGKVPENISAKALFDKLNFKLEELIRQLKPGVLCEPLFKPPKPLSEAQWKQLESIAAELSTEYNLRRQMLLTRLEVTIQSFQWSDKMKHRGNEIAAKFQSKMKELEALKQASDQIDIIALLAARSDLAVIEKTSSANVRKNTGSKIHKHVIGSVPDRGGRAHEHAPPPPEMPSWQQQRAGGPPGGGRGGYQGGGYQGGGGRGGGGGNWRGGGGGGGGRGGFGGQNQGDRGSFGGSQSQTSRGGHWQQYGNNSQQQPQQQQLDQNWVTGSGRVQGSGWTQVKQEIKQEYGGGGNYHSNNDYQGNDRRNSGGSIGGGSGRGDNNYRGRSNYNRGGGGGGGHRR